MRVKSGPGVSLPPKETGIGRAAIESDEDPAENDLTSSSSFPTKCPVLKAEISEAVEAAEAEEPEIGTGGAGGAWRMSSMLWIGVIPQIGSFEKGQPYASAPTACRRCKSAAAHTGDDPGLLRPMPVTRARIRSWPGAGASGVPAPDVEPPDPAVAMSVTPYPFIPALRFSRGKMSNG
jgi:hypothetical protein